MAQQHHLLHHDGAAIGDLAADILRVHVEPCEYIDEASVHQVLTANPRAYLTYLETSLRDIAAGISSIEMPSKAIFTDGPGLGDFRVMPCVFRSARGVLKTVKIVGTNLTEVDVPDQVTVGKAVSLHPNDNYIRRIYEACLLSSARTGACAVIGMRKLARSRRRMAIVGSGRVAYYIALYANAAGGVEEFVFYDKDADRAERIAHWASLELGVPSRAGRGPVAEADVVVVATTAREPLFGPRDLDTDLVISVGADTEEQRELHSSWAANADIYVDVLDSVKVGDIRSWLAEGAISKDRLPTLLDIVREGPGRGRFRRRVFISTGSALFDNLTISYIEGQEE